MIDEGSHKHPNAAMLELVDKLAWGASAREGVLVQVQLAAQETESEMVRFFFINNRPAFLQVEV